MSKEETLLSLAAPFQGFLYKYAFLVEEGTEVRNPPTPWKALAALLVGTIHSKAFSSLSLINLCPWPGKKDVLPIELCCFCSLATRNRRVLSWDFLGRVRNVRECSSLFCAACQLSCQFIMWINSVIVWVWPLIVEALIKKKKFMENHLALAEILVHVQKKFTFSLRPPVCPSSSNTSPWIFKHRKIVELHTQLDEEGPVDFSCYLVTCPFHHSL